MLHSFDINGVLFIQNKHLSTGNSTVDEADEAAEEGLLLSEVLGSLSSATVQLVGFCLLACGRIVKSW